MKREKLNLGSIKNVLSRAEMKKIMAGSGSGPGGCGLAGQSCDLKNGGYCCVNLVCSGDTGTCGPF